MRSSQVVFVAGLAGLLSCSNVGASFAGNFSMVDLKGNLTKVKALPDLKVTHLLNATKAAVADLKNVTATMILDKEAKLAEIEAAFKADVFKAPAEAEAESSGVVSFAQTEQAEDNKADDNKATDDNKVDDEIKADDANKADCWDEAPKDNQQFSCEQQKEWGKCGESWMTSADAPKNGWCAKTCGRC